MKTFRPLSDAVVLWRADVGDADQRSESLPGRGPVRYNTLPPERPEASTASVLSGSSVSSQTETVFYQNHFKTAVRIYILPEKILKLWRKNPKFHSRSKLYTGS